MTAKEALKALLADDATLATYLTGGVFDASDFQRQGVSTQTAPRDDTQTFIRPFAVIAWQSTNRDGPAQMLAGRQVIEIYVYGDRGYVAIDAAISQIRRLLDRHNLQADDLRHGKLWYVMASNELRAEEISNLPMRFIRFTMTKVEV